MPHADLLLIAAAIAAVVDWIAVARASKPLEWIAKPATLALLLLWGAQGPHATWALLAALTFSLLGDVYLMLPAELFLAGLSAFLVGHVFFVVAFDATMLARGIWFVIVMLVTAPLSLRLLRAAPDLPTRIAIGLYMTVIALMVGSAIASGSRVAAAGALLFMASDAMIALNRFVAPFAGARLAIIVTYHLGQFLLVYALRA
ncbi:MAG: lysoplasmalogenase [Deltaproteobacteria bacterium]|nr:lysoplasmalogenase [Deltaproteobacteria bacterium]